MRTAASESASSGLLRIGDLAARSGLSVEGVRFYERLGLLAPEARSGGNQRLYGPQSLERLHKIGQLKRLGLSLEEVARVLPLYFGEDAGLSGKKAVLDILRQRLAETDRRIAELENARNTIRSDIRRIEALVRELSGED